MKGGYRETFAVGHGRSLSLVSPLNALLNDLVMQTFQMKQFSIRLRHICQHRRYIAQ